MIILRYKHQPINNTVQLNRWKQLKRFQYMMEWGANVDTEGIFIEIPQVHRRILCLCLISLKCGLKGRSTIPLTHHGFQASKPRLNVIGMKSCGAVTPTNGMVHWRGWLEAQRFNCSRWTFPGIMDNEGLLGDASLPRDFPSGARAGFGNIEKVNPFLPFSWVYLSFCCPLAQPERAIDHRTWHLCLSLSCLCCRWTSWQKQDDEVELQQVGDMTTMLAFSWTGAYAPCGLAGALQSSVSLLLPILSLPFHSKKIWRSLAGYRYGFHQTPPRHQEICEVWGYHASGDRVSKHLGTNLSKFERCACFWRRTLTPCLS